MPSRIAFCRTLPAWFLIGAIGAVTPALAQQYPDRPIRMVVPFAAGGGSDAVGRVIAQKLTESLGQSVVVENRTGGGGSIGAGQVARSPGDGYTLLLGSNSEIAQYPNVAESVPYDSLRDFSPISLIATVPLALTVNDALPVKTVAELLAYARQNPGKLNYGSAGPGSTTHLAMALLTSMTGTEMTHVPYRGSAPVMTDLLAGTLQLAMPTMSAVLPHASSGKVRVLAVSTAKRAVTMPDAPSIQEAGVAGYATGLWTGLLAPASTPQPIVTQLNAAVQEALASPEVQKLLISQGAEASGSSPEEFAAEIRKELALWKDVLQRTGIRVN